MNDESNCIKLSEVNISNTIRLDGFGHLYRSVYFEGCVYTVCGRIYDFNLQDVICFKMKV